MKLRNQFLVPILVSLSLMVALAYSGIVFILDSVVEDQTDRFTEFMETSLEEESQEKILEIQANLSRLSRTGLGQVAPFSRLPQVVTAYEMALSGNIDDENSPEGQEAREMLREVFRPIFLGYQSATGESSFTIHYHLPNGRSLARVYQDYQVTRNGIRLDVSDDISGFRETVMQVNRQRQAVMGVEVGRAGFDIRGLTPVTGPGGQHLGSVEVQISFEQLLIESRTSDSEYFAVYMDQDLLSIATRMSDRSRYPLVGNEFVFVSATDRALTDSSVELPLLRSGFSGTEMSLVGNYHLAAFPLRDFSGEAVGVMVRVRDISDWREILSDIQLDGQQTLDTLIWQMALFSAALLLIMALLVLLVTGGVTGPIQVVVQTLEQVSLGNTGQSGLRVGGQRKHGSAEVQLLEESLDKLVASLQKREKLALEIANGDLCSTVTLLSEKDGLGQALHTMVERLNEILGRVLQAVEQIDTGSQQISDSTQYLSQGATEQAASLEEISASINEVNGQSLGNAENAQQAHNLADKAAKDGVSGKDLMTQLVTAMGRINESSDEIRKVVKLIDDIAFQINLLALNANVEAARAGKYGKGFAVVAEEVRNLAARAAKAVKETSGMVDMSLESIKTGTQLVTRTAENLEDIVQGSSKVQALVQEIAEASRGQALAIKQVVEALDQVDQVTQSNTASAEESAAAAQELAAQGQELSRLTKLFKLRANKGKHLLPGRGIPE